MADEQPDEISQTIGPWILDQYNAIKTHLRDYHSQCDTEDSYYNREFDIDVGENCSITIPPTAQVAVDNAASQIDTTTINVSVPSRRPVYQGEANSDKIRKYLMGAWHQIKRQDGLVLHHAGKNGFLYGMIGPLKLMVDPDLRFPITIRTLNPQQFFPHPSGAFVIEAYERKGIDVNLEWGLNVDNEAQQLWLEFWTNNRVVYMYGEEIVYDLPHPFGFIPYYWDDAGLGYVDAEDKPEKLYRGILYPVHDALVAEGRLYSQFESVVQNTAWPSIMFGGENPKKVLETMAKWEVGPGKKHHVPAGVTVEILQGETAPPQAMALHDQIRVDIDNATVPRTARGEPAKGVTSGYMTAVLGGMARLKYGPIVMNLQSMIERINEDLLKLVENVFGEISVWGYGAGGEMIDETITAADVQGYYVNFVQISAVPSEERERALMIGLRLYQSGAISRRYFITNYLKPSNPQEVEDQIDLDELKKMPMFQQMIGMAAMESYEAAEMLGQAGAENARNQLLGTAGEAVPPMPGEYAEFERTGGARPIMAGSIEALDRISRAQGGATGMPRHGLNAMKEAVRAIKEKRER